MTELLELRSHVRQCNTSGVTELKDLTAVACNKMFKEAILDLQQNLLHMFFATKFSSFMTMCLGIFSAWFSFIMVQIHFFYNSMYV